MRRQLTPLQILPKFSVGNFYFLDSVSSLGVDSGSYLKILYHQYPEIKASRFYFHLSLIY